MELDALFGFGVIPHRFRGQAIEEMDDDHLLPGELIGVHRPADAVNVADFDGFDLVFGNAFAAKAADGDRPIAIADPKDAHRRAFLGGADIGFENLAGEVDILPGDLVDLVDVINRVVVADFEFLRLFAFLDHATEVFFLKL